MRPVVVLSGASLSLSLAACEPARLPTDAGSDAYVVRPPVAVGLDLLFMVDTSGAMAEEQSMLVDALPRLFAAITSGDLDADGIEDMAPITSLHVGIVTPNMGAAQYTGVPTCAPGLGDDGILRARSRITVTPCMADYPSGIFEFAAGDAVEDFSSSIGCVAYAGTGGCGFEQQLEAALKAVTPTRPQEWTAEGYVPPRFVSAEGAIDAVPGNAQGRNRGFVRADSALAIVLVTDEDDCSVRDYGLFVTADPRFMSVPLNLRCHTYGEPQMGIVHPVARYVDGFLGLRRDPRLLLFSLIAGIPPATEPLADEGLWDEVLADPNMIPRPNAMGTNLEPACSTANGVGYAPIRMVETARGLDALGARVTASSICTTSFDPAMDRLLASLAPIFPRR